MNTSIYINPIFNEYKGVELDSLYLLFGIPQVFRYFEPFDETLEQLARSDTHLIRQAKEPHFVNSLLVFKRFSIRRQILYDLVNVASQKHTILVIRVLF